MAVSTRTAPMPPKKPKTDDRKKVPTDPGARNYQQQAANEGRSGCSGRGADSVLAHLIEQEKTRNGKRG